MNVHAKQPEETIPQEELWDWIIQNNVEQFTNVVNFDVLTTSNSIQTLL